MIALQIGNETLTETELMPLLASTQLASQLLMERLIERAIAPIVCSSEEVVTACKQFYQQHQLTTEAAVQHWLVRHGLKRDHLEAIATRPLRIQKFKQTTWGKQINSYFLKRKRQLDQVVYSLIRTNDQDLAHELYFRLQAGEQRFSKLALEYSQGPERQTAGLVGPVELGSLNPYLAQLLLASQPGQLWAPKLVNGWFVIVRLERIIPVQLNEEVSNRLLHEQFEAWLHEQTQGTETIASVN